MQSFIELRNAINEFKIPRGEKLVKQSKAKGKDPELTITQKGREFKLYIGKEMADSFKDKKSADKGMQQVAKLMGIRL